MPSTSGELTSGCSQCGTPENAAGKIETMKNAIMPIPITSVRRASSARVEMICTPLIMMKTAVNSIAEAMTGGGMIASTATKPGTNAPAARIAATTKAIRRLATPVAATRPTFAVDTVCP